MDEQDRRDAGELARGRTPDLAAKGVRVIAVTWVDNSGITRVKAVPLAKLESAAAWGIGASPCFDTFLFNDELATPGAVGELRLHPDLSRLTVLAAQPGWAWAPADRYDLDGDPHPVDQRTLARTAVQRLAEHGYQARMAFEVEWVIGWDDGVFQPAVRGPGYGNARLVHQSEYVRDIVVALAEQDIEVDQIHPEYGPGQFEVSVAAADPVSAADDYVLVRETIRAISARQGMRVSFSPKVIVNHVGNGGHVHLSLWRDGRNLFAGGDGPFGLTAEAESFTAGILERLPALLAVGAPSVASYLRLIPQHWAGAYAVWGLENREAALRMVTGPAGNRDHAANLEVKSFDQTANPYLLVAALIFGGLSGVDARTRLPAPVDVDPALLSDDERDRRGIRRLPASLGDSTDAFAADPVLTGAFGPDLTAAILAVRRGEIEHFEQSSPAEIVEQLRWVH
ncbi:MAG TPA: glutamine synthetase family protein [Pseudonocardiaceae bacterium]|jgi:glutamine synthetase|nr:glutamine synthetase family protein [Pseudonocardiaceae bacterium]